MRSSNLALLLFVLGGFSLHATPTLYLNPSSTASASAGHTTGWGFTITNATDYLVVDSFTLNVPASLGTFTDFSQTNYIVVGPGPAESPSITQLFNPSQPAGIGSIQISPTAHLGTTTGDIVMTYGLYSVDPNDPNFNSGDDLGTSTLTVAASIVVNAPEPATLGLTSLAALLTLLIGRRHSWRPLWNR